jgi:hypothetical protein
MNCTASPLLIEKRRQAMTEKDRGIFDSRTSKYAEEGSAAHALAEAALNALFYRPPNDTWGVPDPREVDMIGTVLVKDEDGNYQIRGKNPFDVRTYSLEACDSDPKFTFVCNEEMQEGVRLYLDTIQDIMELVADAANPSVEIEARTYPFGRESENVFGTADCIVATLDEIWVVDFKYGRREVSAVENTQALFYAAGAFDKVGGTPDTRVNVVIVQPRVEFADGRSISDWGLSGAELIEWRDEKLKPAIDLTMDPRNIRFRMGDYCGFCPVAASCPLQQKVALQAAEDAFTEDVVSLPYEEAGRVSLILPTETDDKGISSALKLASALDLWSKKVKELADERALAGNELPGFKLVRKRANRKWKDEHKTILALRAAMDKEDWEEAFTTKLKSPAQLEKSGFDQGLVDEYSHKPQGGLTVVHETDRRPAATTSLDWLNEPVE